MKKKVYVISLIYFFIDLLTKLLIIKFEDNLPVNIVDNFFSIVKVTNEGGAFSLFYGYSIVLVFVALLVLYFIDKNFISDVKTKFGFVGISLLIGGILGNLFDRVIYGHVIDFLSFNIFGFSFPVFNFADVFICVGVGLLIIEMFRGEKSGDKSRSIRKKN